MAISIAVIDSGVNPWHSHVQGVEGGVAFQVAASGDVVESDYFRDELGHGTAIAGIIREKVPQAHLHAVKIFHKELHAPARLLFVALKWTINRHIKIIHLSLGTERAQDRVELDGLCRDAYEKGIVIVAAARTPDDMVYPGAFDTVIGVCWDRACQEDSLVYHPGKAVEFGAYGRPRTIAGLSQERNFSGSSFAAARVTALAAQFLEQNPHAGTFLVRDMLQQSATRG
jgi:subtilisin family serine protease